MTITFDIRFEGRIADQHQLDMRQLGQSLIGMEKSVGDALFMAVEGRLPLARERRALQVRVEPPHSACVELTGLVTAAPGILPIAWEMLRDPGTRLLWDMISAILKLRGGQSNDAERHIRDSFETVRQVHRREVADRRDEREHTTERIRMAYENDGEWRAAMLQLADKLATPLKNLVAPVGPSAEVLSLRGPTDTTVIDVPVAEAIRSNEPLEVGAMMKLRVRVDGMIKHSRLLKVELEDAPGRFINAEIRDPSFDVRPNAYTRAFDNDEFIEVDVKPTYREGELFKLHIMDTAA